MCAELKAQHMILIPESALLSGLQFHVWGVLVLDLLSRNGGHWRSDKWFRVYAKNVWNFPVLWPPVP